MRRIATAVIMAMLLATNAQAGIFSSGAGKNVNKNKEQSIGQHRTMEKKQTQGQKQSTSQATKQSIETKKAIDKAKEITNGIHLEATVSIQDVIMPVVAKLENNSRIALFRRCKVFTRQRTLGDFLKFEQDGVVDLIAKQYYENVAAQGGYVSCSNCVEYARCLIDYGAVLGQALSYLISDLNDLQAKGVVKVQKIDKGDKDIIKIKGISLETLQNMYLGEIIKALRQGGYFVNYAKGIRLSNKVKLTKSMDSFLIYGNGHSVNVALPYGCRIDGIKWLESVEGDMYVAGLTANIKASSGWSYKEALNTMKASSQLREKVKQIENYADNLLSRGMSEEYVLLMKKATDLLEKSDTNFDPLSLVPVH